MLTPETASAATGTLMELLFAVVAAATSGAMSAIVGVVIAVPGIVLVSLFVSVRLL